MKRIKFLILFFICVVASSCRSTRLPVGLSEERRSEVNAFTQGFRELCVSVTPRFEEIARIIDVIAGKLWPL